MNKDEDIIAFDHDLQELTIKYKPLLTNQTMISRLVVSATLWALIIAPSHMQAMGEIQISILDAVDALREEEDKEGEPNETV